ncbi:MAG: Fe(3+) ABC transporter substrate-binding protein [Pseudomonadota bacterium]
MRRFAYVWLGVLPLLVLAGCSAEEASSPAQEGAPVISGSVNLYSSRHYDTDLALYENFTKTTGIKVNRIEAAADALIERVQSEGQYSPADILITVDAGRLWRAEQADVFAATSSEILNTRVPKNLRHPAGLWFGLSTRARIIIYNKNRPKPAPLDTYQDLANPAHRGQVCVRSSSNIYNVSLLASLVSHLGAEAAEAWTKAVVDNFARKPQSNDVGQIKAVASGACGISIVNSYYLARLIAANDPAAAAIGVVFPNQDSTGTHINISGAGVLKYAPNAENAVKFLEYLTSEAAQSFFASGNHEYPVVAAVPQTAALASLGAFKPDALNASELGKYQAEAVRIFDRAGWP